MLRSSKPVLLLVCWICLVGLAYRAQAQSQTSNATTDPAEASTLNSIFEKWGISGTSANWNTTGDPCSGAAVGSSPTIDDTDYNPLIKCDCSYRNSTLCHITALRVNTLDVSGSIPDELWSLTYLTNLNLAQNVLTGNLSSSIANLTRMQYLSIYINALSGQLPEELGSLTDLRSLSFGSNRFSGPLPSSLGNLTKLEQLYCDSAGVSGEIPSTFAKLKNSRIVSASDNAFTGRIPDFIANWSNLTTLRLEGNSFEGPIPSELSSLTSLTELKIGDLINGSSSLGFVRNMKSLAVLVLRNANISDSIPSNIGEYQYLAQLDLSFNSLSGEIPDSLFNLGLLESLFLGNNMLNGTLPSRKSSSLSNIDVSYNNLGGGLPSWTTNNENLELNLVGNNFTIPQTNSSSCLQSGFPCYRGSPIYSEFAVKCGGPQIKSSSGIVYESDNETLGPATYYVTDGRRWGVSNAGYFAGTIAPQYINSTSSQVTNTQESELFQTARISASSLRYYGLGLENGNYSVLLLFAEIAIQNGNTWKSLGKRVFDVYIQGVRVLKDFDIRQEAGGISLRAIQKSFNTTVTENYLEIHLRWAGKGTCCIPAQGTYGPAISAISVSPDFVPTVSNKPPTSKKDNTGVIVGSAVAAGVASFMLVLLVLFAIRRKKRQVAFDEGQVAFDEDVAELVGIDNKPYNFSYAALKAATEEFGPANKLGEGGFGPVYKGKLSDGRAIAVKQLSVGSHQGKSQFVTEIATISAVQHRNLVKLYGCCIEGDNRLLVYEYLENKSLDQALFGENSLQLDWPRRYDICLGIARGLAYLHEESRIRIVHRDVKASNILLDSDLVPKISDFGLAKLYDEKNTHISTLVAGTIGYLAPEYAMRGRLTEKADVFAFGVVVLEIISGRPNSDSSLEEDKIYLLEWAWTLYENGRQIDLVDSKLQEFSPEEVKRLTDVALLCTQTSPQLRPSMSQVVVMLSGGMEVGCVTSRPGYLADWKFEDITSFITNNATRGTDTSHDTSQFDSSTSASTVAETEQLHFNASKPMLH